MASLSHISKELTTTPQGICLQPKSFMIRFFLFVFGMIFNWNHILGKLRMLYGHLLLHAEIYIYIGWIHTDAIIIKTHDDKVARTNDARRKEDAGRLLYNIFYLTSLFVSFERVVPSLRVRESWRPNITEIFWPQSYGRQRCVFLVLHGCSTGPWSKLFCMLAFPTTRVQLRLPLYCLPSFSPSPAVLNSSALYYLQTPTQ